MQFRLLSKGGQDEVIDNRQIEDQAIIAYYFSMTGEVFKQRVLDAMQRHAMTKAELSRRSGVPYHAMDKWLKGISRDTSTSNAVAIAGALGITVDDETQYEELRSLFSQLPTEKRAFLLEAARGLLK